MKRRIAELLAQRRVSDCAQTAMSGHTLGHSEECDGGWKPACVAERIVVRGKRVGSKTNAAASTWTRLFYQSKKNAKIRGIPFALSLAEFKVLADRNGSCCELTGIQFDFGAANGKRRPFAPSLDRIRCEEGYSVENCRVVCVAVNIAMNTWGEGVLLKIARSLCAKRDGVEYASD